MRKSTPRLSGDWREWPLAARLRFLARLRTEELKDDLRADPSLIFRRGGMTADPWQAEALASDAPRALWACSRQIGKSETAAALALKTAVVEAPALVLI